MNAPRFRVDIEAVRHNAGEWRRFLAPRELWAVVKSNGYGLGAATIARACIDAGATRLCVLDIEEGKNLRNAGISAPIVLIATAPAADFESALKLDVAVTLEDWHRADTLDALARKSKTTARAHIAIDTGTGWSGLQPTQVKPFAKQAAQLRHIHWEGLWTHIAGAESLREQVSAFERAAALLREAGLHVDYEHVGSTAGAIIGTPGNAARIGIGLFGSTDGQPTLALHLKTAIELRADVISVKRFESDSALGYAGTAQAKTGDVIATLRAGYADGVPSGLANRGAVALNGELCPVVGAIGMNFTMVKPPRGIDVSPGDEAIIVGDLDGVRLDDVASNARTIPHQVLIALAAAHFANPGA